MIVISDKTFSDVYIRSLDLLHKNPQYITCPRGMKVKENLNVCLVIDDPVFCFYSNPRRSTQYRYVAAEFLWYFMGRSDLNFIEKYSSFWRNIANPDDTVNSAYGNLIFKQKNEYGYSQWQWAMTSLIKDKDSRQAVMLFNKPMYQYENNKDFICTLNGIFTIRDNRINLTINMRSNDVILGTPTDVAFFCVLLQQAHRLLLQFYPDLKIGKYTHVANSYHLYERHFDLAEEMLSLNTYPVKSPDLDIDLIDLSGQPSDELVELMSCIENNKVYNSNSKFLNWIYQKIEK